MQSTKVAENTFLELTRNTNLKIDWKKKYLDLHKLYYEQHDELRKSYAKHIETLEAWSQSIDVNIVEFGLLVIGGIVLGITLTIGLL